MKGVGVTMVLAVSLAVGVFAGGIRGFRCSNPKCEFNAEVRTGTGMKGTLVAGYCLPCAKMVQVGFQNADLKNGRPPAIAGVWDSTTGRVIDLFECPACKKPFAAISQMVHCPKCGQKTISETNDGKWD